MYIAQVMDSRETAPDVLELDVVVRTVRPGSVWMVIISDLNLDAPDWLKSFSLIVRNEERPDDISTNHPIEVEVNAVAKALQYAVVTRFLSQNTRYKPVEAANG